MEDRKRYCAPGAAKRFADKQRHQQGHSPQRDTPKGKYAGAIYGVAAEKRPAATYITELGKPPLFVQTPRHVRGSGRGTSKGTGERPGD